MTQLGGVSSNESDDGNSDSAMTTLPIGDRTSGTHRTSSSLGMRDSFEPSTLQPYGGSLQRHPQQQRAAKFVGGGFQQQQQQQQPHHHQFHLGSAGSKTDGSNHSNALPMTTTIDAATGYPIMSPPEAMMMSPRSTFAFWTLVIIMFVLALGNLALTVSIVGVLRVGRGLEFMELVPEADTIKFYGETYLERVYKRDGHIEGFTDVPVSIGGDNGAVQISLLKANGHPHNRMRLSKNGTTFHGFAGMELRSPVDGASLFSTHRPHYTMPGGAENVRAKMVSTSRLTAAIDQPLMVNHTRGRLVFRGTEGVRMAGAQITLAADQNVWLHSLNGTVRLEAAHGVHLDVDSMPVVGDRDGVKLDGRHFKLCVCMPQGRLFRVPVTAATASGHAAKGLCSHFGADSDPCA